MDDVYIAGGTRGVGESALPPSILGDCVVQEVLPNAEGDEVDASAVGAATVHECLDDPNGATDADATYAKVEGEDNVVLQVFPDFTDFGEAVVAIEIEEHARGQAGGGSKHYPAVRRGGTTLLGANYAPVPNSGTYLRMSHILEEDPHTEVEWTLADINGSQFGFKQTH